MLPRLDSACVWITGQRMMKFNFLIIVGILLAALGLATLLHSDIPMPAKRDELQIGSMKVPIETRRIITVPPVVSGLILVCGAGLVFFGARKP
jgi:hypothetical protein